MKSAPEVLMYALLHKFKQNAALGKQLQGTSGKILAHTFEKLVNGIPQQSLLAYFTNDLV